MEEEVTGWRAESFILAKETDDLKKRITELEVKLADCWTVTVAELERDNDDLRQANRECETECDKLRKERDRLALTLNHIKTGYIAFSAVMEESDL